MNTPNSTRSWQKALVLLVAKLASFSAVAFWAAAARGQAGAAWPEMPGRAAAHNGVLLLRNGEVLQGKIVQSGESWIVYVDDGEIRIRASEAESHCDSLDQAYLQLRAAMGPGGANDHLRLAQWCLHQGLLDRAEIELRDSRAQDPEHPMLNVLERRLAACRQPRVAPTAAKTVASEVSSDDLDRMVRGLSPQTIELFTQRIQPLLTNNCTSAGCHGPQSETGFRLLRVPTDQPPSRRLTQRNLHAVLRWISHDDPAASKLLSIPLQPHGTAKAAIFADQQTPAFQRLREWSYLAVSRGAGEGVFPEQTLASSPARTEPIGGEPGAKGAGGGVVQAGYNAPADAPRGSAARPVRKHYTPKSPPAPDEPSQADKKAEKSGDDDAADPPKPRVTLPRSAQFPALVPTDPFDPAAFNRNAK